jgi:hypothetical protein
MRTMNLIGINTSQSIGPGSATQIIAKLIQRDVGHADAELFEKFRLSGTEALADTARELLAHTPPLFGQCAAMSAMWAALLRDRHHIPAMVVAGDLIIEGCTVFLCDRNIPNPLTESELRIPDWEGHCWMEIANYIGDISIFRTARNIDRPSVLRRFIEQRFGLNRGMMLLPRSSLNDLSMKYVPKYVLTESQMNGLIAGMRDEIHNLQG